MARKMSKLRRSNLAHQRLARKHYRNGPENVMSWIKSAYHSFVMSRQLKEKRILTESEKRRIYRSCEFDAFN